MHLCSEVYDRYVLTLLEPQPRSGDTPLKHQVVCPQNGTAVLTGLTCPWHMIVYIFPYNIYILYTYIYIYPYVYRRILFGFGFFKRWNMYHAWWHKAFVQQIYIIRIGNYCEFRPHEKKFGLHPTPPVSRYERIPNGIRTPGVHTSRFGEFRKRIQVRSAGMITNSECGPAGSILWLLLLHCEFRGRTYACLFVLDCCLQHKLTRLLLFFSNIPICIPVFPVIIWSYIPDVALDYLFFVLVFPINIYLLSSGHFVFLKM